MKDRATILKVARAIHLAKLQECSFPGHPGYTGYDAALLRQPWPENRKEAERLLQAGQSWMDLAIAQAKAAIEVLEEPTPRPYMGQIMAECDCTSQELCRAHGRCIANE